VGPSGDSVVAVRVEAAAEGAYRAVVEMAKCDARPEQRPVGHSAQQLRRGKLDPGGAERLLVAGGNTCNALRDRGRCRGRSQINDWCIRTTSLVHHSAGGPGLKQLRGQCHEADQMRKIPGFSLRPVECREHIMICDCVS
jgi:hypothetical protein